MKIHRNTVLPVLVAAALLLPALAPAQTEEPEPWWTAALAPVLRYVPEPPPILRYVPEPPPVPWLPEPFPGFGYQPATAYPHPLDILWFHARSGDLPAEAESVVAELEAQLSEAWPRSRTQAETRWERARGCETAHYAGVVLMDEAARLSDLARRRDVKLLEPAPLSEPTLTPPPVFDPVSRVQRQAASALERSAVMLWHHWRSPPCTGR